MAITDGIYELRTVLQTAMAADIAGGSTTKGANVQLYSANDTNAQKFRIVDEGDGSSLQNVQSGMFVDVAGGASANGTNVQQYADNDTRAQRWTVTDTGETVTIDGVSCTVATLRSNVTDSAYMMMDVKGALTTDKANIQIYTANSTDAQKWALMPTTVRDATIPAPAALGWVRTVGDDDAQTVLPSASTLYPTWLFSPAWAPVGGNGFEYRTRVRYIDAGTLATGSWSAWSAWAPAAVTVKGQRAWLTSGIDASLDASAYKAKDVQLQVRSTSTAGADDAHGLAATQILRAVAPVTVTVSGLELGAEGIALPYSSTYAGGTTTLTVSSIKDADGREILVSPVSFYGASQAGAVEIPYEATRALLSPGDAATVYFTVGTDQYAGDGLTASQSVTVSYATGRAGDLAPTIAQGAGRVLDVDPSASGIAGAWIAHPGGVQPAIKNTDGTFAAPYPFGADCTLLVTERNAAGTEWRSYTGEYAAGFDGLKPCHAFNWADGGAFILELNAGGPITTEFSAKADAEAVAYSGRPWESYAYGTAKDGTFAAEGVVDELTESTKADLAELLERGHVVYRAPSGELFDAAVTATSYGTRPYGLTTVTVNGAREAV